MNKRVIVLTMLIFAVVCTSVLAAVGAAQEKEPMASELVLAADVGATSKVFLLAGNTLITEGHFANGKTFEIVCARLLIADGIALWEVSRGAQGTEPAPMSAGDILVFLPPVDP